MLDELVVEFQFGIRWAGYRPSFGLRVYPETGETPQVDWSDEALRRIALFVFELYVLRLKHKEVLTQDDVDPPLLNLF